MRIVAIDQGTTSTRALVFEDGLAPRLAASFRQRQYYARAGWVEQDPLEILAHVRACLEAAGPADAIGIANQGESCLAWDAVTLEPLHPIIVWQDRRTAAEVEAMRARGLEPWVRARSGLPLDSYFSASKLAWLIGHAPGAKAALKAGRLRLGTSETFLIEHLTGVHATDPTTASRTGLMNIATLEWDQPLCEAFGVPIEVLAPIRPTTGPFGDHRGAPVTASVVDQQAALFGHGCREPGDAKITFGTGAFALAISGETPPAPRDDGLISTVAWRTPRGTRYALEGGVHDAGGAVEWALRIGLIDEPATLNAFSAPPAIGRGLAFVPALSGLACPQWDPRATGLWIGMTMATTRSDLRQAILEGVALQTRDVIEQLDRRVGLRGAIAVDGGLSASDYFLGFLAEVTGMTVVRGDSAELTAQGCALLAGLERVPAASPRMRAFSPGAIGNSQRQDWIHRYAKARDASRRWGDTAWPPPDQPTTL